MATPLTFPDGLPDGAAWFAFKSWGLWHGPGALKVCTDSCWLGALFAQFAPKQASSFADLGAGTGLLAGMLAHQRPNAHVALIEPDPGAIAYAQANVLRWALGDRLSLYGQTLEDFASGARKEGRSYEGLVINPPFYLPGPPLQRGGGIERALLRQPTYDLDRWALDALELLTEGGAAFMMHLPAQEALIGEAIRQGRGHVSGQHLFTPREGQPAIRQVTVFGPGKWGGHPPSTTLWAQMAHDGQPSVAFRELLAPFYPHF